MEKQKLELKIIELKKQLNNESDLSKRAALENEIKNNLVLLLSIGKAKNRMITTR